MLKPKRLQMRRRLRISNAVRNLKQIKRRKQLRKVLQMPTPMLQSLYKNQPNNKINNKKGIERTKDRIVRRLKSPRWFTSPKSNLLQRKWLKKYNRSSQRAKKWLKNSHPPMLNQASLSVKFQSFSK